MTGLARLFPVPLNLHYFLCLLGLPWFCPALLCLLSSLRLLNYHPSSLSRLLLCQPVPQPYMRWCLSVPQLTLSQRHLGALICLGTCRLGKNGWTRHGGSDFERRKHSSNLLLGCSSCSSSGQSMFILATARVTTSNSSSNWTDCSQKREAENQAGRNTV